MGWTHRGDPGDPPGQATGLSPARLHLGPWQTSPGAMEATSDRRATTQSRRGPPARQSGPATQTTRVRRSYRRQAGAIPLVVRDTPHARAAPRAAAQKRGHVALPMDTCGDTLPPGTHAPGCHDNATSPSPHTPRRASRSPRHPYPSTTPSPRHHHSRSPGRHRARHRRPMSTSPSRSPLRPYPSSTPAPAPPGTASPATTAGPRPPPAAPRTRARTPPPPGPPSTSPGGLPPLCRSSAAG